MIVAMSTALQKPSARLRHLYDHLDPAEKRVADFVGLHRDEVLTMTVAELAQAAQVSTATVMRFARALGFDGYTHFKLALAAESQEPDVVQDIGSTDPVREVARKVIQSDIRALQDTLELLDLGAFEQAVEWMGKARKIEFYGVGSSAPIAVDAYYRLLRIGMGVGVVTDAHMQVVSAARLGPEDLAVFISHTGRTRETLETLQVAREQGAKTLGITSFHHTPLTERCELCLITATAETAYRTEAMSSRIAHLSVIDALYVALATLNEGQAQQHLDTTSQLIEEKRFKKGT